MSLYGAMYAGVSGLAAQSSSMGVIADNITNVNTVGFKANSTQFKTLITKQVSLTAYAPGGVQATPMKGIDVQGLMMATNSSTDIAVSGEGFFVVNQSANPGTGDVWSYTRAGSFRVDAQGYLVNSGGYYLQAWPTLPDGTLGYYDSFGVAQTINPNIISSANLRPINLNTIGGTAVATGEVDISANLPSTSAVGDEHVTDVLIYDSLGNANDIEFHWVNQASNEWGIRLTPPAGSATLTGRDAAGQVYAASGRIDFTTVPTAGQSLTVTTAAGNLVIQFNAGAVAHDDATGTLNVDLSQVTDLPALVNQLQGQIDAVLADPATYPNLTSRLQGGLGTGSLFSIDTQNNSILIEQAFGASAMSVDVTGMGTSVRQAAANGNSGVFDIAALDLDVPAITFNGDGTPAEINLATIEIEWANGATDMEGGREIAVNLGTINKTDGMTQFAGAYTPNFINQNGAAFGNFAGVSVNRDGVVRALFDNGESRVIYRIPVATFVNPNGMDAVSGNAYIETDYSGSYTLRTAGDGGAGLVESASLESSTVELAREFTNMIVTQRAYSAAAKIITSADEMMDELIRLKR